MTIIDDGIDYPPLQVPATSYVADPNYADSVETEYGVVSAAHPTHDPNRTTVHVPTEKTVLSAGAASPVWKTDVGVTAYTATHIHFETKTNDKTIVTLGTGATTADVAGYSKEPPTASQGYAMVTAERAWHEAEGQHYLLSREGDISLRALAAGKRAVVQAEQGFVDIHGGEEVNVAGGAVAIGASSKNTTFEKVAYDGNFKGSAPTSSSAATAKGRVSSLGSVFTVHDLVRKAVKTAPKLKPKSLKKDGVPWTDVIKWGLDATKFALSFDKVKALIEHPSGAPSGAVKIAAEKDIGALAGEDVSLAGTAAASFASARFTTVSAGLMATLKSMLFAGVSSFSTSIRGQKRLEIASAWGEIKVSAKKNITLSSEKELSAAGESATVGAKRVVLGAGKRAFMGVEPGFGFQFDATGIAFGKASGVATMKTAKIEDYPSIRMTDATIAIAQSAATTVTLSESSCVVKAPSIHIDAKQKKVHIKGTTVIAGK
jgi:hypothetical protein